MSLENALKASWELMADQPLFYTREVLVILGSSNTRDAFDIYDAVGRAVQGSMVVSILSLASKTYLGDQICDRTRGKHEVALNEHDFKLKLMVAETHQAHTAPRERIPEKVINTQFIVSFPRLVFKEAPVLCANTNQLMYYPFTKQASIPVHPLQSLQLRDAIALRSLQGAADLLDADRSFKAGEN